MQGSREREVVVEIEHTKVVRKRATTRVRRCNECGECTDFLLLNKAAELFELAPTEILNFISSHSCHFVTGKEGEIHLCLARLLTVMQERTNRNGIKLLEGTKNNAPI